MCELKRWFIWLLFCLLLAPGFGSPVIKAEPIYSVSESELTSLLANLQQLKADCQLQLEQLRSSKQKIENLQNQLAIYEQRMSDYGQQLKDLESRLQTSEELLTTLQIQLAETQKSLNEALKSFEEYRNAVQVEITRLKWQRNGAVIVAILILIFK